MKRLSPEDTARHNKVLESRKAFEFESKSADNSAALGAIKHVSDRVKANNQALNRFYKDCKLVDSLPISEDLKCQIVSQLVACIRDCFKSLEESI